MFQRTDSLTRSPKNATFERLVRLPHDQRYAFVVANMHSLRLEMKMDAVLRLFPEEPECCYELARLNAINPKLFWQTMNQVCNEKLLSPTLRLRLLNSTEGMIANARELINALEVVHVWDRLEVLIPHCSLIKLAPDSYNRILELLHVDHVYQFALKTVSDYKQLIAALSFAPHDIKLKLLQTFEYQMNVRSNIGSLLILFPDEERYDLAVKYSHFVITGNALEKVLPHLPKDKRYQYACDNFRKGYLCQQILPHLTLQEGFEFSRTRHLDMVLGKDLSLFSVNADHGEVVVYEEESCCRLM
jgi:hypothetical protein